MVNSNFYKSAIENLIQENVIGFNDNKISVQISSGPTYQPISLWVHEFQPANEEFLALPHIKMDKDGNIGSQFIRGYAPPLALPPTSAKALREKCQEHVDLIAKGPRCEGELYYKHTSIVPWDVFNAIDRYSRSTNVRILVCLMLKEWSGNLETGRACEKGNSPLRHAFFYDPNFAVHWRLS